MPRLAYVSKKFKPETMQTIAQAEQICAEYQAQGFDLTLRQLYYQFVSRDLIPNQSAAYNRLGSIISDARLAGLLDWSYIVDRTRGITKRAHFDSPGDVINAAAWSYGRDLWTEQNTRIEVWIEKDALTGVIAPTCRENDVTYFSCRGYASQSEMWAAGQRLGRYCAAGQDVTILHLGDHDPSGLDMTRDIDDRLNLFLRTDWIRSEHANDPSRSTDDIVGQWDDRWKVDVHRIALTMDQVDLYRPPPNPAKATDARFAAYSDEYGDESWELDALDPTILAALIDDEVAQLRDPDVWGVATALEETERETVKVAAGRWDEVATYLTGETAA